MWSGITHRHSFYPMQQSKPNAQLGCYKNKLQNNITKGMLWWGGQYTAWVQLNSDHFYLKIVLLSIEFIIIMITHQVFVSKTRKKQIVIILLHISQELHHKTHSLLLNDIVNYIKNQGISESSTLEGIIPSATLLTGVNQPDHVSQFTSLIDLIR